MAPQVRISRELIEKTTLALDVSFWLEVNAYLSATARSAPQPKPYFLLSPRAIAHQPLQQSLSLCHNRFRSFSGVVRSASTGAAGRFAAGGSTTATAAAVPALSTKTAASSSQAPMPAPANFPDWPGIGLSEDHYEPVSVNAAQ
jgi:hypothetical protein